VGDCRGGTQIPVGVALQRQAVALAYKDTGDVPAPREGCSVSEAEKKGSITRSSFRERKTYTNELKCIGVITKKLSHIPNRDACLKGESKKKNRG